jgi:hypothetical protein
VRLERVQISIRLIDVKRMVMIGIAVELESQRPRLMVSADLAIPREKLDQLLIFAWLRFDPEHDSEHEGLLCAL